MRWYGPAAAASCPWGNQAESSQVRRLSCTYSEEALRAQSSCVPPMCDIVPPTSFLWFGSVALLEAGPCGAVKCKAESVGDLAWAPRLLCACSPAPPPPQALPFSCAKCEHELATQPALTFHPLGRMAIFVLRDPAEWSLYYPHSCQLSPVALLWEKAPGSPSRDPNHLKSRGQGEKASRRAGKEPGLPEFLPGLGGQKEAQWRSCSCRNRSARTGSEWL